MRGKLFVVSGPSGVGKSSITNRMQKEIQMETGEISKKLKKGKHSIELTYCTPYVIPGMYLSVSGLFLFLMIGIFYRRPKKQRERGNQEK